MQTAEPTGTLDVALAHATRLLERRPDLAEQQARAVLQAVPDHPQAVLLLGTARRLQGDAADAAAILGKLAAAQPRSAQTRYELALALAATGETAAALQAADTAVNLKPDMPEAWRTLADLLTLAGETDAADAAYARHIQAAVHDPRLMAAATAMCDGKLAIAERLLRDHVRQAPTDVAAIRMLAETGTRLGRYADAEKLLRRCLELAPSFTGARHNYAVVLFRQHKAAEAIPHIEHLLAGNPRDPTYRNLLAACLATSAEYDRAITVYQDVLRDFPNQPKIWMSYGHSLRTAGRQAESVAAYRKSLSMAPGLGEAYWSLANLKTVKLTDADVAAMQAQLARADLPPEDRYHFHYALGRALEERADYANAFTQYAAGATLRRAELPYDAGHTSARVARAKSFFSAALCAKTAGQGCDDPAPIFVVGLPRSGSTLIEQILSSHSAVEGTMELADIAMIAKELGAETADGPGYPEILGDFSPDRLAALGARYLARTARYRKLGRLHFIDKMPNNWVHVGLIALILPRAKIIDARRHPMAACFSAFKQHFASGQHFSYDLTELGRYYQDYVSLMAHFDEALPGRIHRVIYEDMVTDTEAQTRALLTHCGLAFEPACLRFWETERAVRTASSEQVRQPIFREGLDQWRHFEPWLSELASALAQPS